MAYQRKGYWYRSRREGDKVVTEYLGWSDRADAIAELDALEQQRRESERVEARARRESELELDRDIDALGDLARKATGAVLLASGYHTHKRQWRRRHNGDIG